MTAAVVAPVAAVAAVVVPGVVDDDAVVVVRVVAGPDARGAANSQLELDGAADERRGDRDARRQLHREHLTADVQRHRAGADRRDDALDLELRLAVDWSSSSRSADTAFDELDVAAFAPRPHGTTRRPCLNDDPRRRGSRGPAAPSACRPARPRTRRRSRCRRRRRCSGDALQPRRLQARAPAPRRDENPFRHFDHSFLAGEQFGSILQESRAAGKTCGRRLRDRQRREDGSRLRRMQRIAAGG